jgi:uncharacterized membrane-anchored protein
MPAQGLSRAKIQTRETIMPTSLNTTLRIAATLTVIGSVALAGRMQAADAHIKAMRQLAELAK